MQAMYDKPIVFGSRVFDRHPVMCKCRREQAEKDEAERKLQEHMDLVRFYIDNWPEMKKTNTGYLLWETVEMERHTSQPALQTH